MPTKQSGGAIHNEGSMTFGKKSLAMFSSNSAEGLGDGGGAVYNLRVMNFNGGAIFSDGYATSTGGAINSVGDLR